ncbi:hypothetical protein [Rhodococcus sp. AD45]|uniref:hypothetical protein n=1 Tax=Rhodococcus sp. (strain AD45) TaxID=103808 RepID=UPI0005E6824D|nr:hypothetical protein [Rhodococcus sp. AD45]KJF19117.1 hypothetical protein SZ00_06044 [Rhodococcus sp. AD45]
MTSHLAALTQQDREDLMTSARDLSDLDSSTRARVNASFNRAYITARGIADGKVDPLTH